MISQPAKRRSDVAASNAPVDNDEAHPAWSCIRKKQYPTEKIAIGMAATITAQSTDGGRVQAYGCRHCGLWHIGSVPGFRLFAAQRPEKRKVDRRVATRRGASTKSYGSTKRRHKRERYQNRSSEDDD